jgi:nucleoside-diphosphate-sugar epimerase
MARPDRIEKFCTATKFRADKIRDLGFEQPVSNEQAIGETMEWHVGHRKKERVILSRLLV